MPERSPFAGCFGGDSSAQQQRAASPIALRDGEQIHLGVNASFPANIGTARAAAAVARPPTAPPMPMPAPPNKWPEMKADDGAAPVFLPIESCIVFTAYIELIRPGGFRVPVPFKSEPQGRRRRHRHLNTIKLVKGESYAIKLEASNCFLVRSFENLRVNGRRLDEARLFFREGADRAVLEGRWRVPEDAAASGRGEREMLVLATAYQLVSGAHVPVEIQLQCKLYAGAGAQSRWGKEFAGAALSIDIRTGRSAADGIPAYHSGTGLRPKPVMPPAVRGAFAPLAGSLSRRSSLRRQEPRPPVEMQA